MIEYPQIKTIPAEYLHRKIEEFLSEDAPEGDVTTLGTVDPEEYTDAFIQAEEDIIFCGMPVIRAIFSDEIELDTKVQDGNSIKKGDIIAEMQGPAAEILTKERVLLNLIQRMSGISTMAAKYAAITNPYNVKTLDTRKTTPGLRLFEKYAVVMGGGYNHRFDLSSGILIKDNHIQAAGGLMEAVEKIKNTGHDLPVELEVESIDQLKAGIEAGADGFLLDNMPPDMVDFAVRLVRRYAGGDKLFLEASGGITLDTIEAYAKTGVNAISTGALTHSVKSADIHLEFL